MDNLKTQLNKQFHLAPKVIKCLGIDLTKEVQNSQTRT